MTRPALESHRSTSASLSALAALAGVLGLLALPEPPSRLMSAAGALGACVACRWLAPRFAAAALLGTAGFLWAALHAQQVLERRWPASAGGERVVAVAIVDSIPITDGSGSRFDASLRIEQRAGPIGLRARVIWPGAANVPSAGERWRLVVALYPPRGRLNPHAVDSERQLFRERTHAAARVVPSSLNVRLSAGRRPLVQLRERIAARIESRVADRDAAALITALAVGHTGGMSREQWRVFNVTGTAHLVAISGLHVTLFAVVAIGAARIVWRAFARVLPRVPRENFAAALGLAAASAYSVLAGFSVPTQRTLIMLGAWFAARAFARHATPAMPLATALVVVLAMDPFAPLAAGFWLSFAAMAAIVLVTGTRVARGGTVAEALRVQGSIALVLAPATLAWFGGVSLAGIAVNLIAIPVVSFVFVPLILLGVTLLPWAAASGALFSLAAGLHGVLWPWLAASADVPHAMLFAAPASWWIILAMIAALVAAVPWPPALRIASVLWLVPLVASGRGPGAGELELTMLDTGRNGAVVARTATQTIVRGIGEGFGTDGRGVENALLPFLRAHAIERIDLLILDRASHRSAIGLNALLANVPVQRIITSEPASDLEQAGVCRAGEWWTRDAIGFRVLGNCAVLVSIGHARVSLMRDAVIVSRASSVASGADVALLAGSGKRGEREAAHVLTTASSGAITVHVSAEGVESIHEERSARRLWREKNREE
ncbi:MAG: DNA internalization-related competence protein ComEC/Rec2 [Gammaproteobacteria bacterium]